MSSSTQSIAPHKPTYSIKPEPLQAEVIALFMAGNSKNSISKQLNIARQTVTNIVDNFATVGNFVEKSVKEVVHLIPKALQVLEDSLDSTDEAIRLRASGMVLKGVGILSSDPIKQAESGINPTTIVNIRNALIQMPVKQAPESTLEASQSDSKAVIDVQATPPLDK